MSDGPRVSSPLLRPVLTLRKEPVGTPAPPGGKKESDIVVSRLETQRQKLLSDIQDIVSSRSTLNFFNDKILVSVRMFADSFAVSKSPKDLISVSGENLLTRPLDTGYLAEVSVNNLTSIYRRIQTGSSVAIRCDISRIKSISPLGRKHVLRNRTIDSMWNQAIEVDGKKAFYIWLAPFKDNLARRELLTHFLEMQERDLLASTYPVVSFGRGISSDVVSRARTERESSIPTLMRYYQSEGKGRAVIRVSSREALRSIIASGSSFRMEPLVGIGTTAPGEGTEPHPRLPPTIAQEPIVGIIDGGCAAQRYSAAEAWRERPFVQDGHSDRRHGNQVTSLVVHGHEWNNNLPLPQLYCRFGTAQAVPRSDVFPPPDPTGLPSYIENIVARHPETKVWNLSWNERLAADSVYVSALGHDLSIIARRHRVLFVVSAGNVENTDGDCIAPPADCEAALVVGGRQFDANGRPTERCPSSLRGYGPDLRLVPHVCSYSPLRLLGGVLERGTSFPTGIISSLAAHSFENLRDPTPDLVKALIIDQCDQN